MSNDNDSETFPDLSSTLCNEFENTKNSLDDNKISKYHQITTAQNELISIQRSLIGELLNNSKEFREIFGDNFNTKNSNCQEQQQQQQTNKEGVECDVMQTDIDSIHNEICFVKSIKDLVKGSSGREKTDNAKFGNEAATKNDYRSEQGFVYYSSQNKENDNFADATNSSPNIIVNEFPKPDKINFVFSGPNNENLPTTSTSPQNNDYLGNYNETNEVNDDYFGEYKGFNSIYLGIGKENIDVEQLKQCLEKNFGHVRFVRIIRNKNCAFAEFEEKDSFAAALGSGYVTLNGANLKINKTFRKKKEN